MKFDDGDIGSNLMYAITNGLYSRDVSAIREYFQNAYDPPALATEINIDFDNNGLNCSIKDNGTGIDSSDLKPALGIGIFTKGKDSEGIFGIGIWSGIAVCDKVVIITKKKGSSIKSRIEINAKAIRETSTNNLKLIDFLSENTGEVERIDAPMEIDQSYTIVRLENILESLRNIKDQKRAFNEEGVMEFASKNLPVPLDPSFAYANEVAAEFDKLFIRPVKLLVGGKPVYRHHAVKDHVREPVIKEFYTNLRREDGEMEKVPIIKAWACLNKEYKTLDKEVRGIDFRHNGFKIEDWSSVKAIKGGPFNERWVGEIHVMKPELLRPTAGRDAFQPVPWRDDIDAQISAWLTEMQSISSYVSVAISGLKRDTEKLNSPAFTKSKKQEIINKVEEKNLNVDINPGETKPEFIPLINELKKEQDTAKTEFEAAKADVETSEPDTKPSLPDMKRAIASLSKNPKLAGELTTLMESKHWEDIKIDPFITLRKQIESMTNETYASFTKATDAIGVKLTLYPNSKHRVKDDQSLKDFLKGVNDVFRNLFEHASEETTKWFTESKDVEKLKEGYAALISFVSRILDELVEIN